MLDWFHAVAKRVYPVRGLLVALAVAACIAFAVGLFVAPGTELFLVALVVLLWSLLSLAAATSFVQPPPVVDPGAAFLSRFRARFWRGYLWLLALATTLLALFVVYLSLRAITMIVRDS